MTADQFVGLVARFTLEGECTFHGEGCDGGSDECVPFEPTASDDRETVESLITFARAIQDQSR